MQKKANRKNLAIRDLGFESESSLVHALRVDHNVYDALIASCDTSYPYECWYENKRSGGKRLIEHPLPDLKRLQQRLNRLLQRLHVPKVFHGCYDGTSILTNAQTHIGRSWFLTFDLANYYKTIRPSKVYQSLRSVKASPDVARAITRLTTIKGHVPQGAPTSPMIAAVAMMNLSRRLVRLCNSLNGRVTIYGDNVCISGPRAIIGHRKTFLRIATTEGFRVRANKTQYVGPNEDKPLPGLIVRKGQATLYDEDLESVTAIIDRCVELGESGLARRVCPRYVCRLRGIVNHYSWINKKIMKINLNRFHSIQWPNDYGRDPCWSPRCHCSPLSNAPVLESHLTLS